MPRASTARRNSVLRPPGVRSRGALLTAPAAPELVGHDVTARPFGETAEARWSLQALGVAATALSFLEPDPGVRWDAARRAEVRDRLTG